MQDTASTHRVILIHHAAPPKPAVGQACNGCGVCCASEPCPAGVWITRRRSGPCAALRWLEAPRRYGCALMLKPEWAQRRGWAWLWRGLNRLAARSIAAGAGCDAQIDVVER